MSDLVGNPEDRFSRVDAHIFASINGNGNGIFSYSPSYDIIMTITIVIKLENRNHCKRDLVQLLK